MCRGSSCSEQIFLFTTRHAYPEFVEGLDIHPHHQVRYPVVLFLCIMPDSPTSSTPTTLSRPQQAWRLIEHSTNVLICLPAQPTTDAIASGLALQAALKQLGHVSAVASADFRLPFHHDFLTDGNSIVSDLPSNHQFVIDLSLANAKVHELSYTVDQDALHIYISPTGGSFSPADVTAKAGSHAYDLIIVVDCQKLDQLGALYDQHAELFYKTPIINIDHHTSNDYFGQVDLVAVKATAVTEIIADLFTDWTQVDITEPIATALLSGMISKTKSFQSTSVTPKALTIASSLIQQGARRDEIVKHLYQSKKLSTLKLWGRVLSSLQSDPDHHIVWSTTTQEDITATGAHVNDVADVIDELLVNTPDVKQAVLFTVLRDGAVKVSLHAAVHINALELFANFHPRGSEMNVSFIVREQPVEQVRELVLGKLRQ